MWRISGIAAQDDGREFGTGATPPDGELAQVEQGMAEAKGTPLSLRILAGRPRSLKSLSNTVKSIIFFGGGESLAGQEKTAGVIGDRQRIAVVMISQQELAVVIGARQLIGLLA